MRLTLLITSVCVATSAPVFAQSPQPSTTVPRVLPVAGVFTPADGQRPAPVETVTLSLYVEETGGRPVWEEVQSVAVDPAGRYHLLLGASLAAGVPLDVFASGEARWLGIRFQRPGEVDSQRTRLTSVPYALSAANADTLGGRPASAYLLAPDAGGPAAGAPGAAAMSATVVVPMAINPGTTNSVAKYLNNGDTIGPSALFESGGNVGIGNGIAIGVGGSSSIDKFNVRFTNTAGTTTGISLRNDGNTASSYSGILFYDQNGALAQFQGFNNVTHEYRINNIARNGSSLFDGSINFMIGSKSRLFVANTGFVGIGTDTPLGSLDVVTDVGFGDVFFTSYLDSASPAFHDIRRSRGNEASPNALLNNDVLLSLGASGYNSNFFSRAAAIEVVAAANFQDTSSPVFMRFSTTPVGTTARSERMRITAAGDVGIGLINPATRLQVSGDVRVGTSGTNGCLQGFGGGVIAGACASDRRFKRDITSFGAVLPAVARLRPVHYYWRTAEFPERQFGDGQSYGLIAQEVEEVLPELVVTNPDGYKAVDYSKLPLLTVQAIKELKAENDALQSKVAELERLVKQLLTDRSRF